MRGTLNSLRSGLESSQSKMALVVSIETPTTCMLKIYRCEDVKDFALQGRLSLVAASTVLSISISKNIIDSKKDHYLRMEVETGSLGPVWKKMMK